MQLCLHGTVLETLGRSVGLLCSLVICPVYQGKAAGVKAGTDRLGGRSRVKTQDDFYLEYLPQVGFDCSSSSARLLSGKHCEGILGYLDTVQCQPARASPGVWFQQMHSA